MEFFPTTLFLTSTKFPIFDPDNNLVPGLSLAYGPTVTLLSMLVFTKCEKEKIFTLFFILTFSPMKTYGSIVTFLPIIVSLEKNIVSGAIILTPCFKNFFLNVSCFLFKSDSFICYFVYS